MTLVRYVGPFDEVTITCIDPTTGGPAEALVAQGDTVDAPDWLAGRAPAGDDPGFGLLAQPGNWQPATPAKNKATSPAGDDREDDAP